MAKRVALVTGSNKGIGVAIVRGLCKNFSGDVYLTARDESRGRETIAKLESEGLHPKFHQLDIDDKASVDRLRQFLSETYGGLDILVNNAGIAYKNDSTAPFTEQAEVTLKTNYWGTLYISQALFPLLRSHARVVNISSYGARFALQRCGESLREKLLSLKSESEVSHYMEKFVSDVKAGNFKEHGWPELAYGISKLGVALLSIVQQLDVDKDATRTDIIVNACCPGYVDTDMTSHKGTKTVDEGADTPLYLALLPANATSPRGAFVSERTVKPLFEPAA